MFYETSDSKHRKWRKFWILAPFLFIGFALLAGWAVMFLWNYVLPGTLGVQPLDFYQALALLALCRILFGGFRGGGGPRHFNRRRREQWMNMSQEERAQMRAEWMERCRRKGETDEK
ncbi:MAG: hypothetical protein JNJ57_00700 [Saprospiraceae bacterium]|nr:hypothetical protein [Saprospiraceae bacterium]